MLRGLGISREQGRQDLNLQPPVLETARSEPRKGITDQRAGKLKEKLHVA
jgi:hypothetical protein